MMHLKLALLFKILRPFFFQRLLSLSQNHKHIWICWLLKTNLMQLLWERGLTFKRLWSDQSKLVLLIFLQNFLKWQTLNTVKIERLSCKNYIHRSKFCFLLYWWISNWFSVFFYQQIFADTIDLINWLI